MKQLFSAFLILISTSLFSQSNDLHKIEIDTGFTWRNSTAAERDSFYLNLPVVRNTSFKTHIRISLVGQRIDLVSDDNKQFSGTLTNSTTEYKTVKTEFGDSYEAFRIVSNKVLLDSSICSLIASKIIESGQPYIPTDSLIPSWNKWFLHCASADFQIKLKSNYVEQYYYCPWSQPDSTEFKDIIVSNYSLLNGSLRLDVYYETFEGLLEKGKTYSKDSYWFKYIMTDQERESWNRDKPRRDYLKSIKDTIDSYLNSNLQNLQSRSDTMTFSCYGAYNLTFGKSGHLKKIWIHPAEKMKLSDGLVWFIEDRVEIWRCKHKIKQIFRKIKLKDFDLQHQIYRTFYFDLQGQWIVTDNTIY